MRAMTSRTATFCGIYTRSRLHYLRVLERVNAQWPHPVPAEVVDVRAMARRALERVSQWRPYE